MARVTYDSKSDDVFTVHMNKGRVMYFKIHKDWLHCHDTADRQVTLIQTVQQNEAGYSQRQLATARSARDLYSKVGHPSVQDFKAMIKNNMILNCPVTLDDIERASKCFGANIAALKGKTVRTKSDPVTSDYIAVPEAVLQANQNVTFSADIMFVNNIPFFTTVSRDIKFTTVEGIETPTIRQLVESTHKVRALYSARGFKLTNANLDGEFIPMRHHLQEMGIIGNFARCAWQSFR